MARNAKDPLRGRGAQERGCTRRPTPQERTFCHAFVETGSVAEAHERAYRGSKANRHSRGTLGARVMARPAVQRYLASLYAEHRAAHGDLLSRIVAEYERIAFADLSGVLEIGADGMVRVDAARVSPELARAIQELVQEETVQGGGATAKTVRKTRVKLLSKLAALEALTKCLGVQGQEPGKSGTSAAAEPLDPAIDAMIDKLMNRGGRGDTG